MRTRVLISEFRKGKWVGYDTSTQDCAAVRVSFLDGDGKEMASVLHLTDDATEPPGD